MDPMNFLAPFVVDLLRQSLPHAVSFAISFLAGETSVIFHNLKGKHKEKRSQELQQLLKQFSDLHLLKDKLRAVPATIEKNKDILGVTEREEQLLALLSDENFQENFAKWLFIGLGPEADDARNNITEYIVAILQNNNASPKEIERFKKEYFERLEKDVFSNPMIAHWRQQLSLNYLREQVEFLKEKAAEAAGEFSEKKQKAALDSYLDLALRTWDIIDLSNLPEEDIHLATQTILLRQLYVPLRMEVDLKKTDQDVDKIEKEQENVLFEIEQQRELKRLWEAGRIEKHEYGHEGIPIGVLLDKGTESFERKGQKCRKVNRFVVLGDPGAGKTTLLRWIATAYLLRQKGDLGLNEFPDVETLPPNNWLPVLIRCRDLGEEDLSRSFQDFITQHFRKTELQPQEAEIITAIVMDRIARGEALILVDGLDEITNAYVRIQFCREMERTAQRYPDTPIIVTSRIVGYREMPYRMKSGFKHHTISDLSDDDKIHFCERWVAVTNQHRLPDDQNKLKQELINALNSSDRIQKLTNNAMLLTTVALVKRKVGKLPSRRHAVYREAVSVLLNWNRIIYEQIEEEEAIPQLEYIAWEMCSRGVQRMSENDVLSLLDDIRKDYGRRLRKINNRTPEEFLQLLEARSSILVKSGSLEGRDQKDGSIWEFRHLTFQEFLAARALIDGRYPGRNRSESLAQQVGSLAGKAAIVANEYIVSEHWREPLRLCLSMCRDDDADDVMLSILQPQKDENRELSVRPRAIFAALCLSDEPPVSEETAKFVLQTFVKFVGAEDGTGKAKKTALDTTAIELSSSEWRDELVRFLAEQFVSRDKNDRWNAGGLCGMVGAADAPSDAKELRTWVTNHTIIIKTGDMLSKIASILAIEKLAFYGQGLIVDGLIEYLIKMIEGDDALIHAAGWALGRLSGGEEWLKKGPWFPNDLELQAIIRVLVRSDSEGYPARWPVIIAGKSSLSNAIGPISSHLKSTSVSTRQVAAIAVGRLAICGCSDSNSISLLIDSLNDSDAQVRENAVISLRHVKDQRTLEPFIACLNDTHDSVRHAAVKALGELEDSRSFASLCSVLENMENPGGMRISAALSLARLKNEAVFEVLLSRLEDPNENQRAVIPQVMGLLGDVRAIEPISNLLDSDDENFQIGCIDGLGLLNDPSVKDLLYSYASKENLSVRVALSCTTALSRLGCKREIVGNAILKIASKIKEREPPIELPPKVNSKQEATSLISSLLKHYDIRVRTGAFGILIVTHSRIDQCLASKDLDGLEPWLDPQSFISEEQLELAIWELGLPPKEVKIRYEAIANKFGLKLEWQSNQTEVQ